MFFTDYTIAQAKRDFSLGYLTSCRLLKVMGLWQVVIYSKAGANGSLVDARTKETRLFKNLDSALNALQSIGFDIGVLQMGKLE